MGNEGKKTKDRKPGIKEFRIKEQE